MEPIQVVKKYWKQSIEESDLIITDVIALYWETYIFQVQALSLYISCIWG